MERDDGDTQTDSSAARSHCGSGPWHVSRDHLAQPDQMSPGCHAREMRLESATDTGIECARWGLEVVPGVSMFDRGGSSKHFTSLAAELYCSLMRGLQCDYEVQIISRSFIFHMRYQSLCIFISLLLEYVIQFHMR